MKQLGAGSDVVVRRSEIVPSDGAAFTVFEQGAGPAMLMLHAGSSDWKAWQLVALQLRRNFRVLAYDRRPYSASEIRRASASMVGEVLDAIAAAGFAREPVFLVGHSSGAVVALEAALRCPSAFRGLVLYEPPVAVMAPLGGEPLRRAREALDAGDGDRAMEIHSLEIAQAPRHVVGLQRLIPPLRRQMRRQAAEQITDDEQIESLGVGLDRYRSLRLPTLLIGGSRSPRHLQERLSALKSVLPCVDEILILEGQGHFATVLAPRRVARAIEDFAMRQYPSATEG